MLTKKQILLVAGCLGFIAVALGAFGAHAFKPALQAAGRLDTYELAVRYQFYHTLAMLMIGVMLRDEAKPFRLSATLLAAGTLLFSGSLYLLCFSGITAIAVVTPFGGLFLLAGWATLVFAVWKSKA